MRTKVPIAQCPAIMVPAVIPRITPMPVPLAIPANSAFLAQGRSETCFALSNESCSRFPVGGGTFEGKLGGWEVDAFEDMVTMMVVWSCNH